MRIFPAIVLLATALSCGDRATPTEPLAIDVESRVEPSAGQDFVMTPGTVVLAPGASREVHIQAPWSYPLGVDFRSTDQSVAQVSGQIPQGGSEGVARITAIAEGSAQVLCVLYNFGRPPGSRVIGTIVVGWQRGRRRSAAP